MIDAMPGHLKLFGVPALKRDDESVGTPPDLPLLLLAYVAGFEEGVSRASVVGRFWPEEDERVARHNLSQLLYRHRKAPWREFLETGPEQLRWLGTCDLPQFQAALATGNWHAATVHPAHDFLAGVRADHNAAVSEWLEEERRGLQAQWRTACLRAANVAGPAEAQGLLRRLLEQDPLDEEAVQAFMRCAIAHGNRGDAVSEYARFKFELQSEMGVKPLAATQQLSEEANSTPKAPTRLPDDSGATPFIGREIELAQIVSAFHPESGDPVRLMTICGPGGMGKSRLAVAAGNQLAGAFADGVRFVALAPLAAPDELPGALAGALGLPTEDSHPEGVIEHLRSRHVLLVIDNFEHVTPAAAFVAQVLNAGKRVSVLATSREPLALQSESVFVLGGLDYPADSADPEALSFEAVRLFLSTARRFGAGVAATKEEVAGVVAVCALLRGMPLGIVLAAAWTRALTPGDLARELARDIDLLQSRHQDTEPRHQSLRAVFDGSWQLLDPAHRETLAGLAVFRGNFDLAAARAVTGTSIPTLLGLVTRSLLERRADGRYDMHEAVRQYSLERLGPDSAQVRQAHASYFMGLAREAEPHLTGQGQQAWLERLAAEQDNLAAAHEFLSSSGDATEALVFANSQFWYWHIRGHYRFGGRIFSALLARATTVPAAVRARALHCSASLAASLHDLATAGAQTLEALALYEELGDRRGIGLAHWQLGTILRDRGDVNRARQHLDQARHTQEEDADEFNLSTTYNDLAIIAAMNGDFDQSAGLFRSSLRLKRKLGDKQGISYALSNLALLADERGDDPVVIRSGLLEALKLKRELDDQRGIIKSLLNLSVIDLRERRLAEASAWLAEGLKRSLALGSLREALEFCAAGAQLMLARGNAREAIILASGTASLWSRNALSTETSLPSGVHFALTAARQDMDEAGSTAAGQLGSELGLSELTSRLEQLLDANAPAPNGDGAGG